MAKLRLAEAAREDLRDIRIYSKKTFGVVIAREYLDGLRGVFALLRERPFAGARDEELLRDLRSFGYRSHRLFYRVNDRDVEIIRILHVARNATQELS